MKFPLKRAGVLLLVVVVALACLGIGYGSWTDSLTINGTGTTGDWGGPGSVGCWGFTEQSKFIQNFNDAGPTDYTVDDSGTFWTDLGHNDGSAVVTNDPETWVDFYYAGHSCYWKLDVLLTNVYPGYANELSYKVVNAGQVPIEVTNIWVEYQGGAMSKPLNPHAYPGAPNYAELDLDGDGNDDLTLWNFDTVGLVINPGILNILTSTLPMRVEDGVQESVALGEVPLGGSYPYTFIVYIEGTLRFDLLP